jgi:cell division protein ZapA
MTSHPHQPQKVAIKILGRDYQVACQPSQKDALTFAARQLEERLKKLRNQVSMNSPYDELLTVVALNLCYELHEAQQDSKPGSEGNQQRLQAMLKKMDGVLKP